MMQQHFTSEKIVCLSPYQTQRTHNTNILSRQCRFYLCKSDQLISRINIKVEIITLFILNNLEIYYLEEQLKNKNVDKKKSKDKLKGIIQDQEKQINQLTKEKLVLNNQIELITKEKDLYISALEKELAQKQDENKELFRKVQLKDQELQEINKQNAQSELKISNVEKELKLQQHENNDLKQKINLLEAQLKVAENKFNTQNQLIETQKKNQEKVEKLKQQLHKNQEEFQNQFKIRDILDKQQLEVEKLKRKSQKNETAKLIQQQIDNFEYRINSGIYKSSHRKISKPLSFKTFKYRIHFKIDQEDSKIKSYKADPDEQLIQLLNKVFQDNSQIKQDQIKKVENQSTNQVYPKEQWNIKLKNLFDNQEKNQFLSLTNY